MMLQETIAELICPASIEVTTILETEVVPLTVKLPPTKVSPVILTLADAFKYSVVKVEPLISATEILVGIVALVTCPTELTVIKDTGPYVAALTPVVLRAIVGLPDVPFAFVIETPAPPVNVLP